MDKHLHPVLLTVSHLKQACQSISILLCFSTNVEIIADLFPPGEHVFNYVRISSSLVIIITHHPSAADGAIGALSVRTPAFGGFKRVI